MTLWTNGDEVLGWTDNRASHAEYVVVPVRSTGSQAHRLVVGGRRFLIRRGVHRVRGRPGGRGRSGRHGGRFCRRRWGRIDCWQLVQVRGARSIGIASAGHHDWLRSVGVTPVAYGEGLLDRIRTAADSGVDAFVDTFGPEYVRLAVELGVAPARIDTIIAFDAAAEVGAKTDGSTAATSVEVLGEMADLVASGRIVVPIAATYPLEKVIDAYAEVEQRHTLGKMVLVP